MNQPFVTMIILSALKDVGESMTEYKTRDVVESLVDTMLRQIDEIQGREINDNGKENSI